MASEKTYMDCKNRKCNQGVATTIADRASLVVRAGGDAHKPSTDGLLSGLTPFGWHHRTAAPSPFKMTLSRLEKVQR